jgi:predicted amidohydrolase
MQNTLNIALIQSGLQWENPAANRNHFDKVIGEMAPADIILLPEMFTSGFTINPQEIAEPMDGPSVLWMLEKASEESALICGSLVIEENGNYYNRFIAAFPDGNLIYSDKRHLFSYAGEDKIYTRGEKRVVFTYKGFRILPQVCYDLRFPVWVRNRNDVDVILYVANWPAPRINAWDTLLKARAIENMCYVAGLNRVGKDANGHGYPGHSAVYGPLGENLTDIAVSKEQTIRAVLDRSHLESIREKFGFLNDRDDFELR